MYMFNRTTRFKNQQFRPLPTLSRSPQRGQLRSPKGCRGDQGKFVELLLTSYVKKDVLQGLSCVGRFIRALDSHLSKTQNNSMPITIEKLDYEKDRTQFQPCARYGRNFHNSFHNSFVLAHLLSSKIVKSKARPSRHAHKFTVIRSPFVFKKTREQFSLTQHGLTVKFNLNGHEQNLFMHYLGLLRLPCECKVKSVA